MLATGLSLLDVAANASTLSNFPLGFRSRARMQELLDRSKRTQGQLQELERSLRAISVTHEARFQEMLTSQQTMEEQIGKLRDQVDHWSSWRSRSPMPANSASLAPYLRWTPTPKTFVFLGVAAGSYAGYKIFRAPTSSRNEGGKVRLAGAFSGACLGMGLGLRAGPVGVAIGALGGLVIGGIGSGLLYDARCHQPRFS